MSPNPRICVISAKGKNTFRPDQVERLTASGETIFHARLDPLSDEELITLAAPADILAITRRSIKHLHAAILRRLPGLKGLAVYSTGYEWVDHYYLAEHGTSLCYLKDYSTVTVAEHIMGLILSMSRKIHLSHDRVRGIAPSHVSLCGKELQGKKLGIIGLGRIGSTVAGLAQAFGMNIYYFDLEQKPAVSGIRFLPLDELLRSCDIISLSASRNYRDPPILTAEMISLIRPGALLINAGRPELVDTQSLMEAINGGRLDGYAVDEILDPSLAAQPRDYGRVLQTGHTAWYSREAIERGTEEWVSNICSLALGLLPAGLTGVRS